MGTDEQEKTPQKEEKKSTQMLIPVLGLILLIAFGLIAFGVRGPAQDLMADNVENFPHSTPQSEDADMAGYLVAGVIFLLELMVSVIVYAMIAPKPDRRVTEKDLQDEKRYKEKEMRERKKLKRLMRAEAAKEGKSFRDQD